jgi:hypothetical protein
MKRTIRETVAEKIAKKPHDKLPPEKAPETVEAPTAEAAE